MTKPKRYVLFHRSHAPPAAELASLKNDPDITILDQTTNRAFLVEATSEAIDRLRNRSADWVIENEIIHSAPGIDRGTKDIS